jgi:hypothetical protein
MPKRSPVSKQEPRIVEMPSQKMAVAYSKVTQMKWRRRSCLHCMVQFTL